MNLKKKITKKDKIILGMGIAGSFIALIWFIITLVDIVNF